MTDVTSSITCRCSICHNLHPSQIGNLIDIPTYIFRFWYISLVSCSRGRPKKQKQCSWSHNTSLNLEMDYDIWFVNGDPNTKHMNPFEHQFSYELHDVLEIYLTFLVLNGFLLTIQVWVFRQQRHVLIYMLTAILTMEVSSTCQFESIHLR